MCPSIHMKQIVQPALSILLMPHKILKNKIRVSFSTALLHCHQSPLSICPETVASIQVSSHRFSSCPKCDAAIVHYGVYSLHNSLLTTCLFPPFTLSHVSASVDRRNDVTGNGRSSPQACKPAVRMGAADLSADR